MSFCNEDGCKDIAVIAGEFSKELCAACAIVKLAGSIEEAPYLRRISQESDTEERLREENEFLEGQCEELTKQVNTLAGHAKESREKIKELQMQLEQKPVVADTMIINDAVFNCTACSNTSPRFGARQSLPRGWRHNNSSELICERCWDGQV